MSTYGVKRVVKPLTILVAVVLIGCLVSSAAFAAKAGKVRVGTADAFGPGFDGSFSLTAQIDNAGNVSGEWQDAFTRNPGVHIKVTCLRIEGNVAWIGGVIDQSADNSEIGLTAMTRVIDGGLPNGGGDYISYTYIFSSGTPNCNTTTFSFVQFPSFQGSVDIKQ